MSATLSEMCELLEMSFRGSVEDFSSIFISPWLSTVSFRNLTNMKTLQVLSPFVSTFLLGYNLFRSFCFCFGFSLFLSCVLFFYHVRIINKISRIKFKYKNNYPTLKLEKKRHSGLEIFCFLSTF